MVKDLAEKTSEFSESERFVSIIIDDMKVHLEDLVWDKNSVNILEMSCNLKAIATVSDSASTNRTFMRMNQVTHYALHFKFLLFEIKTDSYLNLNLCISIDY